MEPSANVSQKHTLILVHGIRTHANWYQRAKEVFASVDGLEVEPIKYGRVDLIRFLVPGPWRNVPVKKTESKILPILDRCRRDGRKVTIIAHSNGTNVITKLLIKNHIFKIDNFIMCGSIIDTDFDWNAISHKITGRIINDYGVKDFWPVFAKSVTWGYGYSGTNGFGAPVVDRLHDTTHSAYFSTEFMRKYWVSFFKTGEIVGPQYGDQEIPSSPWWFYLLEFPIKWLLLIAMSVLAFGAINQIVRDWFKATEIEPVEVVDKREKFAYYSIDANRRPTANRGELTIDGVSGELPLFDEVKVGMVLKALSSKNLRFEPTTNSAAEVIEAGDCIQVIKGSNVKDESPGSALSAGWLPVVLSPCLAHVSIRRNTGDSPKTLISENSKTAGSETPSVGRAETDVLKSNTTVQPPFGGASNGAMASNANSGEEKRKLHRMNLWLGYTSLWKDTDVCIYINSEKVDCFRMGKGPTFSMIPLDVTDGDRWEIAGNVGRQTDSLPRYEYTSRLKGSGRLKFPIYSDVSIVSKTMSDGNMIANLEPGRPIQSTGE